MFDRQDVEVPIPGLVEIEALAADDAVAPARPRNHDAEGDGAQVDGGTQKQRCDGRREAAQPATDPGPAEKVGGIGAPLQRLPIIGERSEAA